MYAIGTGDYTACGILNPNFVDTTQALADYYNNNTMDLYVALPNQWRTTANSTGNCPYNQWNHIAYSVDQTSYTATLYINGTLIKSLTGTAAFSGSNYIIALGCGANVRGFNGYMRQFQYYNTILTSAQIQSVYIA
jgi:hypothetical protein